MLQGFILRADGSPPLRVDRRLSLKEKQEIVGGLIQLVPAWDRFIGRPAVVYANEEGLLEGLPINLGATAAWRSYLNETVGREGYYPDMAVLVGDVLIITADTEEELEDA